MKIPFNKPYLSGKETTYIEEAVNSGKISGNGVFTKKCHDFFEKRYGFKKCLLTTSCTDALEMCAILLDLEKGDEIIIPSYTFVSTANAFVLRGANIVFADSEADYPNISPKSIRSLITDKTKAIVVVHYAGIACDMEEIMNIAEENNIYVIEDAAQAIDSYYKGKALGSFGHLSAFSFHETKNIISGEGGMLVINDEKFVDRAEIIWEKGTNRSAFFRGEVDKYNWVDMGSSFLPSDIIAAFLFAQLECLDKIQKKRIHIWNYYYSELLKLEKAQIFSLPKIPDHRTNNAHMFFLLFNDVKARDAFISYLKDNGILSVFHYLSLHKSPFYESRYQGNDLINSDFFTENIVRLPLYYELKDSEIEFIITTIQKFVKNYEK